MVLSGDNAVVIALAARSCPAAAEEGDLLGQRRGIVMRIVLTLIAVEMPQGLAEGGGRGAAGLHRRALLQEDEHGEGGEAHEAGGMMTAIRTILVADLVMSLDNVLAGGRRRQGRQRAAGHRPGGQHSALIIFGSTLLLKVMERFPIIITLGGALLGFLAGEMHHRPGRDEPLRRILARGRQRAPARWAPCWWWVVGLVCSAARGA